MDRSPGSTPSRHRAISSRCDVGDRRAVRRVAFALAGAGVAAAGVLAVSGGATAYAALPSECTQTASTVTCTYGPGSGRFSVPAGVTSLQVTVSGASGGDGGPYGETPGGTGGVGTTETATVTVTPGQSVLYTAGARGGNGAFNVGDGAAGGAGGAGDGAGGAGGVTSGDVGGAGGGGGGGSAVDAGAVVLRGAGGGGGAGGNAGTRGGDGQAPDRTTAGPDGGTGGTGTPGGSGGGGGGGQVGGAGGDPGFLGPGAGGYQGVSAGPNLATAAPRGDGQVVITYEAPATTPPNPTGTCTGDTPSSNHAALKADLCTTISAPATLTVGQTATISITVTNRGEATAAKVRTTLLLPSTLRSAQPGAQRSFDLASLQPGASQTYTQSVTAVRTSPRSALTAVAMSRTPDENTRDNRQSATVRVSG